MPDDEIYIPTSDAPVGASDDPANNVLDFDPDPPGADPDPANYEPIGDAGEADVIAGSDDASIDDPNR